MSYSPMPLAEAKNTMIWIEENRSLYDYQQQLAEELQMLEEEDLNT